MIKNYIYASLFCMLSWCGWSQQNLPFTEVFAPTEEYNFENGWSADNVVVNVVLVPDVNGYSGTDNTGSAMFNLFNTQGLSEFNLTSPVLANPDAAKIKLTFDFASALRKTVPAALPFDFPNDKFQIYISTNGGTSYVLFEEHSLSLDGDFNTGGFVQMSGFTPTESQWLTHTTSLPAGTNRVLFKIYRPEASAPGSNFNYLDNVIFEICAAETPQGASVQYNVAYNTLADLVVEGEQLTWYSDEELTNEIPDTTTLIDGTTYYVTSIVDGCESDPLAITFDSELASVDDLNFINMKIYPNPATSIVNIDGIDNFSQAILLDMTGKQIAKTKENTMRISGIASGVYQLIIQAGKAQRVEKLIIK